MQGEWEVVACVIDGADQSSLYEGDRWHFHGGEVVRLARLCSSPYYWLRADPAAAPPDAEVVQPHVLERLSLGAAVRLEGRRQLYRVRVNGPAGPDGDEYYWSVAAPGTEDGLVALPAGDLNGELTVEAVLHVQIVLPRPGRGGTLRYRLEKAALVGP